MPGAERVENEADDLASRGDRDHRCRGSRKPQAPRGQQRERDEREPDGSGRNHQPDQRQRGDSARRVETDCTHDGGEAGSDGAGSDPSLRALALGARRGDENGPERRDGEGERRVGGQTLPGHDRDHGRECPLRRHDRGDDTNLPRLHRGIHDQEGPRISEAGDRQPTNLGGARNARSRGQEGQRDDQPERRDPGNRR